MIRRPPRSTLFPTRRSSDLVSTKSERRARRNGSSTSSACSKRCASRSDRKSTRLNSSHEWISYAVFCLKKKKKKKKRCHVENTYKRYPKQQRQVFRMRCAQR